MDKLEEAIFVLNILIDLKRYPDHNKDELDYLIDILKRRRDSLEHND